MGPELRPESSFLKFYSVFNRMQKELAERVGREPPGGFVKMASLAEHPQRARRTAAFRTALRSRERQELGRVAVVTGSANERPLSSTDRSKAASPVSTNLAGGRHMNRCPFSTSDRGGAGRQQLGA